MRERIERVGTLGSGVTVNAETSGVESFCGAFQQFPISEIYLDGEVALRDYANGCALPILWAPLWLSASKAILHSTLEFRVWKSRIRLSRNCKERVCGSVHDLLIKLKRCPHPPLEEIP
jgi:hypothetical protein